MAALKKNIIANYLGQGWRTLMGIVFIPVYIQYLGVESYGLIGIFAILQAWLRLLDAGLTPALSREMAYFVGGAREVPFMGDLLRSVEVVAVGVGFLISFGVWGASNWLAGDWLQAEKLPIEVVAEALIVMGVVVALRFIENIYTSSLQGLQRQVLLNVVTSLMMTLRGVGAVGILVWISPTIEAFFLWQGFISIITVLVLARYTYRTIPISVGCGRFSLKVLSEIWQFAGGMLAITLTGLLLAQIDNIMLSSLLSLEAYGHYVFSVTVASGLYVFVTPISKAFYPRFSELLAKNKYQDLVGSYHDAAQMVSVLMGSASLVLIFCSDIFLELWLHDTDLSHQLAPLVSIIALKVFLNGLMWIPYQMQLAYGWTSLTNKIHIVAIVIIVPAILWVVPRYGMIGAAWVGVGLNVAHVFISVNFMFGKILVGEKLRWYFQDVFFPLLAATLCVLGAKSIYDPNMGGILKLFWLFAVSASACFVAGVTAPTTRRLIAGLFKGMFAFRTVKR
ncbi:MAG: oligosaccharide flippase family protein [Magnetococcales bacterium]|nr:oligosaccharide flippase family protein [Magnetococcales bacterium]